MSKEELIISLLKSKQSNNNNNFNFDDKDDKISDIKKIFNRLRDMLPKKCRKEIKNILYEIENKENLSEAEKEENDEYLTKLVRTLDKKEKYCSYDCDDPDYYGIRDIENLFSEVDEEDLQTNISQKFF